MMIVEMLMVIVVVMVVWAVLAMAMPALKMTHVV